MQVVRRIRPANFKIFLVPKINKIVILIFFFAYRISIIVPRAMLCVPVCPSKISFCCYICRTQVFFCCLRKPADRRHIDLRLPLIFLFFVCCFWFVMSLFQQLLRFFFLISYIFSDSPVRLKDDTAAIFCV